MKSPMNHPTSRLLLATAVTAIATTVLFGCSRGPDTSPMTSSQPTIGNQVDDTVITTRVKSALLSDDNVSGLDVHVESRMGTVELTGTVDDQGQILQAAAIARRVEGVTDVQNSLTLKDSSRSFGTQMDDATVTGHVKSALLSDPNISGLDITVTTVQGEVQLSGVVDSQQQIDRAAEMARSAEGASSVKNDLQVKR